MAPNFNLNVSLSHGVQHVHRWYTHLFDIIREESHKFIQLFMAFSQQRLTKGSAPKLLPLATWNFLIWNFSAFFRKKKFLLFLHFNWLLFDFQLPVSFTILFTCAFMLYIFFFYRLDVRRVTNSWCLFLKEFSNGLFYFIFFLKSTISICNWGSAFWWKHINKVLLKPFFNLIERIEPIWMLNELFGLL